MHRKIPSVLAPFRDVLVDMVSYRGVKADSVMREGEEEGPVRAKHQSYTGSRSWHGELVRLKAKATVKVEDTTIAAGPRFRSNPLLRVQGEHNIFDMYSWLEIH